MLLWPLGCLVPAGHCNQCSMVLSGQQFSISGPKCMIHIRGWRVSWDILVLCKVLSWLSLLKDLSHAAPLSYFLFQPVFHDWCNKGCGMCYPVCGMVHIKEPLLLIDKSSLCGNSGFPFSLSEWSLTICVTPYNRR